MMKVNGRRWCLLIGAGIAMHADAACAGCPQGQYEGLFGWCYPEINDPPIIGEVSVQAAGSALEQWINESRNNSIAGAQPIPQDIRRALTGYIDEDSMNKSRYVIGDAGAFNFAGLSLQFNGDVGAVTLIDVIVFRDQAAADNVPLWAHELTHVKQYTDWGTHDFAVSYARNFHDVEDPAYAVGNGYIAWMQSNTNTQTMGDWCSTPIGRFGPEQIAEPLGAPCFVISDSGQRVDGVYTN